MAKTYYDFSSQEPYPFDPNVGGGLVTSIMEAIRYHYSTNVLYKAEPYAVSKNRWVLADATTSMQMRGNEKQFNWSNAKFPFTAYTIGELIADDRVPNYYARSHRYYSQKYDRIISANAMVLEIVMYSFFNTAIDYHRAQSLLLDDDAMKTLKEVPIMINNELTSFPIIIDPEIVKGNLAYEFEQQLRAGKIFDINHTVKIYYHELMVNYDTSPRRGAFIVGPVDDIEVALKSLPKHEIGQELIYGSGVVVDTPQVISTMPEDGQESVNLDSDIIFNFNVSMNKSSVETNLLITPGVNADYVWNDSQTILTLDKIDPFVSGVSYSCSLSKKAQSVYGQGMQNDYDFTFIAG
jgi:hypothetical protein